MEKTYTYKDGQLLHEVSTEQQNSLEMSKNAKGEWAFKAKVYHDNPEKVKELMSDMIQKANELMEGEHV